MPTRVLLVDDHPILRSSLRDYLSRQPLRFEVIGEAGDTDTAWREIALHEPDVVILDLEIPRENGVVLTQKIKQAYPRTIVLILTGHCGVQRINQALEAGASGYVLKSCTPQEISAALDATAAGQVYLSPGASTVVVREYQRQLNGESDKILSARELDILGRIADGHTTKEIAFAMHVSTKTVETHRLNIMAKLDINTVAGLTKYAIREGLTTVT